MFVYRIVLRMPAILPDFWEQVASHLASGHSARDCCIKYMAAKQPSKKMLVHAQKQTDERVTITGKIGTIKRKRQLREVMESLDENYVDDYFESTPYKKSAKTVVNVCFNNVVYCSLPLKYVRNYTRH